MQIKLSCRLQKIADFVLPGSRVADIGTDHGTVPVYLIEEGIASFAIASDRAKTPVAVVQNLVSQWNLEKNISVRQGDGLTILEPNEVDTVIIAGMGGMLIQDILEHTPAITTTIKRFILQPQRNVPEVRQWLQQNGLQIVGEELVFEEGYYYEIIVAEPGLMSLTADEIMFGPCLLQQRHSLLKEYWQNRKEEYQAFIEKLEGELLLKSAGESRKQQLKNMIKKIDEVILCQ